MMGLEKGAEMDMHCVNSINWLRYDNGALQSKESEQTPTQSINLIKTLLIYHQVNVLNSILLLY